MPIPMLIGAGVAAVGGLLGQLLGNSSRAEAERILAQVRDEFGRIDPAKVKAVAAEVLGPSALQGLQNGDEMNAMGDSLGRMGDAVEQGGMTLADRASLNDALDASGQQDRAQRASIDQQYAGTGGQGMLAKLMGQQASAQRASRAGTTAAGDAQRRYWQMVSQRAGLADQVYGNKAGAAEAQDAVSRWNATSRTNAATANNALAQQRFDNDYRVIAGKAGVQQQIASGKAADADRTAELGGRLGAVAGKTVDRYLNRDDEDNYGR